MTITLHNIFVRKHQKHSLAKMLHYKNRWFNGAKSKRIWLS